MPTSRFIKSKVRRRMKSTGERYTTALRHILEEQTTSTPRSKDVADTNESEIESIRDISESLAK